MNTKYIFLDIDGTLVGKDAKIPESAKAAIMQARKNGHKVFICSGRSKCEMYEGLLSIELDGIVGSAGAYVEIDGQVIYHQPMTKEMNTRLFTYFKEKNMPIILETNYELYANDLALKHMKKYVADCEKNNKPYDKGLFDLAQPLDGILHPEELPINKILYVMSPFENEEIREDLNKEFTVVSSAIGLEGNSGELSELGMHKGNGIRKVIEFYKASIEDTIGIGDGENDIDMLKTTGVAIAMGNAVLPLKEIADFVTSDLDQDGIKNAFAYCGLL